MKKYYTYHLVAAFTTSITSQNGELNYEELREMLRSSDSRVLHDDLQGGAFEMSYVTKVGPINEDEL